MSVCSPVSSSSSPERLLHSDLTFIRGGGHIHFPGAAGIEDGVTIDLGKIKDVVHHEINHTVSVGAGAVWDDVYSQLDKINVMVTGARASSVGMKPVLFQIASCSDRLLPSGVAGSTLGGGNSYYAARKGLICDGVRRFEIVLGDGSIVTASRETRSDLFRALKGGSSNFGIVTRFDYDAFKGGKIFGGVVTRPLTTADLQFPALYRFANAIASDPYSSIIVISVYFSTQKEPFFMDVIDYTKPAKPADIPILKEFIDMPHKLSDSTGLRNMTSLAAEFEVPKDHRTSFSTITFRNDVRVMERAHEAFQEVVQKLKAEAKGDWAIYTLYQPIPPLFARHGNEHGGNVLGLDRFRDTLILYEPYLKWQGAEQDSLFEGQARYLRHEIDSYAKSIGANNQWIYLNYADREQFPLESFGAENVERIRAAAKKYDPKSVFQYMMPGGFKISKVRPLKRSSAHIACLADGYRSTISGSRRSIPRREEFAGQTRLPKWFVAIILTGIGMECWTLVQHTTA